MNSRRHKSKDLLKEYADENEICELGWELGLQWDERGRLKPIWPACTLRIPRHDIHHIKGGTPRYDLLSNLIAIDGQPHHLYHFGIRGEQRPIQILCMLAKARKAIRIDDPAEFDIDELDIAFGKPGKTKGLVEIFEFDESWNWMEEYRAELLELIG